VTGARPRASRAGLLVALFVATGAAGCAGARKQGLEEPPEVVYQEALRQMDRKKYYRVRSMLQETLPRIPPDDRDLLPQVQLTMADAFFLDGGLLNYGEALNAYRCFLTFYPTHERADYAQYMVGMSLFRQVLAPDRDQTLTRNAIAELNKLEALYPFSDYVLDARRVIGTCRNRLAEHERLVGLFYQKRGAWEAAIDRYRNVMAAFPQFDNMNKVLLDLGACLLEIDQRVEAGDLLDRLSREDGEGKLAARGRRLLEEYDRKQAKIERKARGAR
jgi:outer membrane protein assembly factor BamD